MGGSGGKGRAMRGAGSVRAQPAEITADGEGPRQVESRLSALRGKVVSTGDERVRRNPGGALPPGTSS
ncbi:hypothetical protein AMYX_20420 [Anaeromyxobacter diazotrophicus]|uniref:Uncharacterized protein n=1 Tax=Anaeromyxobacter diazotrophicus TaxID=2590199 RepID=A0A7I9VLM8_9BACT|nr:hypothetical protein AMYX_20420 [Anaeromyxobacter diazotrophicus]